MRISLNIEKGPKKSVPKGEVGMPGTSVFGGVPRDEYLYELTGKTGITTYDKMRRSDAQVKMTLKAVKLPLLQATWTIQPAEEDPQGEQVAEAVKRILLNGGTQSWSYTLRHALLMLDFGFSPMEKVWELRDLPEELKGTGAPPKVIWLKKLAPRLPKTITEWIGLEDNNLTALRQELETGGQMFDIPLEKLVIFVNEKEGDNWTGISLLRSAYKHWWIKEHLENIDAIGHERTSLGIPVAKVDHSATNLNDTLKQWELILANLQANEKNYVVEAPGTDFRFEVCNATNEGLLNSIDYHSRMIAVNVLAQFMELGNTETGSRAVATEQRGPFDLSLLAMAQEVADTFNQFVIKELVDFNFGERSVYPKLVAESVTDKGMDKLALILKDLTAANIITPDTELEKWIREQLNLPELEEKNIRKPPVPPGTDQTATDGMPATSTEPVPGESTGDTEGMKSVPKSGETVPKKGTKALEEYEATVRAAQELKLNPFYFMATEESKDD